MNKDFLELKKKPLSLTESFTNELRNSIMNGDLTLGQPVSETMLSNKYSVGKTPVRESLYRLKQEGIVNIIPQKGSFIYNPSHQDVIDLCEFRVYLEPLAIKEAISVHKDSFLDDLEILVTKMNRSLKRENIRLYLQLDNEFHIAFFTHCKNPHLKETYKLVSTKAAAIRSNITSNMSLEMAKYTNGHHNEIFNLLTDGDVNMAVSVLTNHIENTKSEFLK
ncbi:MAG: DNA-binding GntR family transcriptional regulator [Granulosicoccus sp.]|jgi:DNA-binding GntR family transcriptional regulator